jgi:hypothetical protein
MSEKDGNRIEIGQRPEDVLNQLLESNGYQMFSEGIALASKKEASDYEGKRV